MTGFTISLAGIPIGVSAIYPSTRDFCADYLCDETPRVSVTITAEDIADEHSFSARQREAEKLPPRRFSAAYLETLALLRKISNCVLDENVVLFHGAAVAVNGRAYLFTAPSGTGKTTHVRLWLEQLSGTHIINGDKPFLLVEQATSSPVVYVCGTPWQGKESYGVNEILPLEAICLLERSSDNHIEPISFADALDTLLRQTHIPDGPASMLKALKIVERIGQSVRLYRLGCNMEPEAARVSIGAMIGDRHE